MKISTVNKNKKQGGFTLVELMIVVVIIGVLGSIFGKQFFGYVENAKGQAIHEITKQINDEIRSIGNNHGVGPNASTTTFLVAGNTYLDVLRFGDDYVNATYQSKYKYSPHTKIEGLDSLSTPTAGTTGTYSIQGMPLSVSENTNGTGNTYTLTQVEPAVLANYITSYASEETFVEGASGGSSDAVAWTFANGQYTLNITYLF